MNIKDDFILSQIDDGYLVGGFIRDFGKKIIYDRDIAIMLKKSGKPVVLCINKADRVGQVDPTFYEFYELICNLGQSI